MTFPILSILIWLPIIVGLLLVAVPHRRAADVIGISTGAIVALLSLLLFLQYDTAHHIFQFNEHHPWIPSLSIAYHLSVDAFSIILISLTALCTFLVLLVGNNQDIKRPQLYAGLFLIMEGLMIGVFCAQDILLFYIFFEAMLIPMYLIIGIWGGTDRIIASVKFFLYTLAGSILFLVAILYLGWSAQSFDLQTVQKISLDTTAQQYLFFAFLLAFGIKVPMWPVHTWLPHAHVEAPTGGSVILAAITLKIGAYAMIRFLLPITTEASLYFSPLIVVLSLIAIVYIGFVAFAQTDMKKIIAYSSVAHMGFVTLGLFTFLTLISESQNSPQTVEKGLVALQGAYFQLISHGLISAALFFAVGYLYKHTHTRAITAYGGVAKVQPFFATLFVLFAMANCGLPGTSGFVGEFFVIISSFSMHAEVAFIAATALILGALYSLWMTKAVIFGPQNTETLAMLKPLQIEEYVVFATLGSLVVLLGVYPNLLLDFTNPSAIHLYQLVAQPL